MNYSRAKEYLGVKLLPNYFIKLSYEPDYKERGMAYVPFPVDLGIVGYRVCFCSPEVAEKVAGVVTLKELRTFSHGQGSGWSDVGILRHNGFKVIEIPNYESLFRMVAADRFDLYCRGAKSTVG
jgi:hypothetical protein